MSRQEQWFLVNGLFFILVIGSINTGSMILTVPMMMIAWFTILSAILVKIVTVGAIKRPDIFKWRDEKPMPTEPSVSPIINITFDLCILVLLIHGGWLVTAVAYAIHAAILPTIFSDLKKIKNSQ